LMGRANYESANSIQREGGAFNQVQNRIYYEEEGNNSQLLGGLEQEVYSN